MALDEDNGILAQIRGDVIGTAAARLPRAGSDQPLELTAEVDAGHPLGLVRIRYRAQQHRHGKSRSWFWVAMHAEQVAVSQDPPPHLPPAPAPPS